jgi:thioredoxin 1
MSTPTRLIALASVVLALVLVVTLKRHTAEDASGPLTPANTQASAGSSTSSPSVVATPPPPATAEREELADAGVAPATANARAHRSAGARSATVALPRLVDVGADKCIPCKAMAPILEDLRREYAGRLRVDFVDAWKHPDEAEPFGVYGIPVQIFFDPSGRELYRHLGFYSKEDILATWRRLGFPLDGEKSVP